MQPILTSLIHVGDTYGNFQVKKSIPIPELQCHLRELVHLPTGAEIMHVANDDVENLFCLSFRTVPENSNGVAHILEHTVLCGSKKFPVKDPFFSMQRRSLNTFMNALTGQDFTCYPAATQVKQDFYNLLDVYLDAVFHPNLNPLSFLQEGHRLEFAVADNPETPLEYKGIVFNEMKGAMSTPGARLGEILNQHLYPDITYGHNSGGDPRHIPNLTYEELVRFHETFYHPSRCIFFFYGNLPLEGHLDFLEEHAFKGVEKRDQLPPIPLQPRFLQPREVIERYPIAPDEQAADKAQIAFGWLTCHILEQETLLALYILRIVLLGTDASPLKMSLLRSGLCKEVSSYIDSDVSEPAFAIVVRGSNPENLEKVEKTLMDSLEAIKQEGIPSSAIEDAIHQLEIVKSEISNDHGPFGLSLFMRSALLKQHGGNAEDGLVIHALFDKIRANVMENPKYLTDLIDKYFIHNTHYVKVLMLPDNELSAKELAEEKATLDRIRASLSENNITKIIQEAKELNEFQKNQEEADLSCLPKVGLQDINRLPRAYPLSEEQSGNLSVFHHNCFTNGITYVDLVCDLPALSEEDIPYVSLFSALLPQIGCGGRSYKDNLDYILAYTGGISASVNLNLQAADCSKFYPSFHIKGKALDRNMKQLFNLMRDMTVDADFSDKDRLKEILLKYFSRLEDSLNQSAIKYAFNLSASSLDDASFLSNTWYGLPQYRLIRTLAQNFDEHAEHLVHKMDQLKQKLLGAGNMDLVLSCNSASYERLRAEQFFSLGDLPAKHSVPWEYRAVIQKQPPQGCVISAPVAFCTQVSKTVSYVHPNSSALNIAAFLCDNLTLHRRIREQGGAYSSGAISNSMTGNFYLYSYRDPHIAATLKTFSEAIHKIALGEFNDSELEEAKLEIIQGSDTPLSPGSRAEVAYGWFKEKKTYEMRINYREKLLDARKEDVIRAVHESLLPYFGQASPVVFAGKAMLEKENEILKALGDPALEIKQI